MEQENKEKLIKLWTALGLLNGMKLPTDESMSIDETIISQEINEEDEKEIYQNLSEGL